jgi:hypothetical protein
MRIVPVFKTFDTHCVQSYIKFGHGSVLTVSKLFSELKRDNILQFDFTNECLMVNYQRFIQIPSEAELKLDTIFSLRIIPVLDKTDPKTKLCEYVRVPSQYDEPYSSDSNQFSWFVSQVIKNKDLLTLYYKEDINKFNILYTQILDNATMIENNTLGGENIYEPGGKIEKNLNSSPQFSLFYSITPDNFTELPDAKGSIVCNRFGESFIAIKINLEHSNDYYLLFSTRIKYCGLISKENLIMLWSKVN